MSQTPVFQQTVDQDRLIRTTRELIAIPSVNPFGSGESSELAAIEYCATRLDAAGFETELQHVANGRSNLIARTPGEAGGKAIALAGHLDTVDVSNYQAPFEARIATGRVYGRGAADMKGGVAVILEIADMIAAGDIQLGGDVVILGICDEEYLMMGSRALNSVDFGADFAVVLEPTELAICPAHRGQIGLIVTTHGVAGHSSTGRLADNAIIHMGAALEALERHAVELQTRGGHQLTGPGSLSVGVIRGGELMAIVPARCEIEIDRRTEPGETPEDVHAEIERVMAAVEVGREGFSYEVEVSEWDVPGLDTPTDHAAVVLLADAHRTATGRPAEVEAFPAATDAPHLGVPSVVYGPGSLDQAHSHDEWVAVDDLVVATTTIATLLSSNQ